VWCVSNLKMLAFSQQQTSDPSINICPIPAADNRAQQRTTGPGAAAASASVPAADNRAQQVCEASWLLPPTKRQLIHQLVFRRPPLNHLDKNFQSHLWLLRMSSVFAQEKPLDPNIKNFNSRGGQVLECFAQLPSN
jgi:hypothetical protein